ncbi:MAK10-like protein [Tanacetum coccineum]
MGDENPIRTLGDNSKPTTKATRIPLSSPTAKLPNDILMFQQHHGESLSEAWTRFKDLQQKFPHHGIDLWLQVQIFMTMSIPSQDEPLTNRPVEANISQASLLQTGMGIEPQQPKEPEPTLKDEFQDLHLNLPILEVLAHALIYNAILDKYIESLELGKNRLAFVQGEVPAKMEDSGLFTLPCRLGGSKLFDTLANLVSCVNIIPFYLFKKLNIGLLEETDHIFRLADGTKSYPVGIVKDVEVHIGKLKLLNDFYLIDMKKDPETPLLVGRGFLATANAVIDCGMAKIAEIARDAWLNPFKDTLVFRRMVEFLGAIPINLKSNMWESEDLIKYLINWDKPPKNGDEAWHAKIRLIDPDGEEFTKTL